MFNIFFEKKFLYHAEINGDKNDMEKILGGAMADNEIADADTARDIMERSNSLRNVMQSSSILTNEDQNRWHRKIDDLKEKPSQEQLKKLEEEFQQEQKSIKKMVAQYTSKVVSNKETAFAVDELKGVNTVKEYLDWFLTLSLEEKKNAMLQIDSEIKERVDLRTQILKLNPQLKSEVIKMDRTSMQEKLKELEVTDDNIKKAWTLLKRDKKYSSNIEEHLENFKDKTPDEQKAWLESYEEKFAQPRKDVFAKFESLPKEYQDGKFLTLRTPEKKAFLEKLESQIENNFIREVNKIPNEIWSEDTKKYAIKEFLQIKNPGEKAARLKMLPEFVKAEQKLTNEYKKLSQYLKDMPDYALNKWEKLQYEEKEEMLTRMETETFMQKNFSYLLGNKMEKNIISEKTYARMMTDYNESTIEKRIGYIRDFSTLIQPREDLLQNFMSLSRETQNQFSEEFNVRGYRARLEIFKEAKNYEAKNSVKTEKKKDEMQKNEALPQPLNSPELKAIIDGLKMQADLYEDQGKIEKALGIHESIIKIDPNNTYSNEKINNLKAQTEALEAVKKLETDANFNEEIGNLALLEFLLKDKENQIAKAGGSEDAQKQFSHLGDDSFKHNLHKSIVEQSDGEKILGKDGKVKDVYTIDIDDFNSGDAYEINKSRGARADNENMVETKMMDTNTGEILSFMNAKQRLEQRKQSAIKNIADIKNGNLSDAKDFIDSRIKKAA